MKTISKHILIRCLVIGALLGGAWFSLRQPGPGAALDPDEAIARYARQGSPGAASQRVVMDFQDIVRQDALIPAAAQPGTIMPQPLPAEAATPTGSTSALPTSTPSPTHTPMPAAASRPLSPAPAASFMAVEDNNYAIPPDTYGSVGTDYVMTMLNTQVRIQTRVGATISSVSLNTFWTSVNETGGTFDPRVLYDPYADRWVATACDDAYNVDSASLLVAVSNSGDPTGLWTFYKISPVDKTWFDYPTIGFNKKWIVISITLADRIGVTQRKEIYAFNKADLYAGGSGLYTRFEDLESGTSWSAAETFDAHQENMYLLQTYNPAAGLLRMGILSGPVGAEVFSTSADSNWTISYGGSWANMPPSGADFAPQLSSSYKIQNNDSRVQQVVYRNGTLWTTHTVFLPVAAPSRSAAQWWQIAPTNPPNILQKGRIEDATNFYAFPSIAVNQYNDVLIGFTRFSAIQYASANYAFRAASDPPNTMRADVTLKLGEDDYYKTLGGPRNRWGDFSHTCVDPANDTDFWTIQEYAAARLGGYDRWGTWWGMVRPPTTPTPTITPTATNTPTITPTFNANVTDWRYLPVIRSP